MKRINSLALALLAGIIIVPTALHPAAAPGGTPIEQFENALTISPLAAANAFVQLPRAEQAKRAPRLITMIIQAPLTAEEKTALFTVLKNAPLTFPERRSSFMRWLIASEDQQQELLQQVIQEYEIALSLLEKPSETITIHFSTDDSSFDQPLTISMATANNYSKVIHDATETDTSSSITIGGHFSEAVVQTILDLMKARVTYTNPHELYTTILAPKKIDNINTVLELIRCADYLDLDPTIISALSMALADFHDQITSDDLKQFLDFTVGHDTKNNIMLTFKKLGKSLGYTPKIKSLQELALQSLSPTIISKGRDVQIAKEKTRIQKQQLEEFRNQQSYIASASSWILGKLGVTPTTPEIAVDITTLPQLTMLEFGQAVLDLPTLITDPDKDRILKRKIFEHALQTYATNYFLQNAAQEGKGNYSAFANSNSHLAPWVKNLSVQDLLDADFPLRGDYLLNVSNLHLNDLTGLKNIPNIQGAHYINLGYNKFSHIDPTQLASIGNVDNLIFWYNQIDSLSDYNFSPIPNLRILQLQHNRLKTISRHALSGLSNLITLQLDNNNITTIEDHAFDDLSQLTQLDLGGNQLTTFNVDLLNNLNRLSLINLRNNRFSREERLRIYDEIMRRWPRGLKVKI